jgi:hypothetical protein
MINLFYTHISNVAIVVLAFLAGEGAAIIDTMTDHPAITSVLAGALAAISVKYVDKWLEGRNKTIKTADEVLKIEAAKQERLEKQQQDLLDEKEAWYKLQADRAKAEHFEKETRYREQIKEASQINHKAINQIMAQQNLILGMQRILILNGLDIPEVTIIELTKFMLPVWENEAESKGDTDGQKQHITVDTEPTK